MKARKTLSVILALALIVSVIAPCSRNVFAATQTIYGENLEQVIAPEIGEEYYLGADVDGTMMYFRHGTISDTVPYSLVVTDNINHNWAFKLTTEDPSVLDENVKNPGSHTTGFQLTYTHPTNSTLARVYCMDSLKDATVAGQTGIMDTGASSGTAYKNRHNFYVDDEEYWIRSTYKTDHVLVIKQVPQTTNGNTADAWRMLFVTETDLANEGVYPVMLLKEHEHNFTGNRYETSADGHKKVCWCGTVAAQEQAHTFGAVTTTGIVKTHSCTVCGYSETAYDQKMQVVAPEIGESYYLAANVEGVLKYFTTGTVTTTAPYSLVTTERESVAVKLTLEDSLSTSENFEGGFQFTFDNNGALTRIYCMDVLKDATTAGQTGIMDTGTQTGVAYKNRHSFFVDEVNGVKVLRKYGNNNILVVKYFDSTSTYRMLGVPEAELANEGVYPVMILEDHAHVAGNAITETTDSAHIYGCWCGGVGKSEAHAYGASTHNLTAKTTTRTCATCGYVAAVHGHSQAQVKYPTIGETYNLVANANGTLYSFTSGGVTETSPYSLKTVTTLATVTVNEALEAVKGEFQLVDASDRYIYSVAAGVGLTTSVNYVTYPDKVSFFMDTVNGVRVIRAYGTNQILAAKYSDTKSAWRIFPVEESEVGTDGVYPVMLTVEHTEHAYDDTWVFDNEAGTQSHVCVACGGAPKDTLYGTDTKASQVTEPATDGTGTYYLGANVEGILKFFTTGTVTNTAPYSLVTTERASVAVQVTLEDSTNTSENFEGGFQFTFDNNGSVTRIYCMDVLKDATTAGQTGIMDTGTQTGVAYKNRHSFWIDEVSGVKVLRKYGNDNILVVKYIDSTGTYRMLGVPEAELANEGVYPVMILDLHNHEFGEEVYGEAEGHYHKCACESKSDVISHSFGDWTLDRENQKQTATCEVCDYTLTTASPYLDTVDSLEELTNGLGETVQVDGAYTVTGGKDYYLMAEIGDDFYYFRNVGKTAAGNAEGTSSTVTETTGHSLYTTNDPSHDNIIKAKVTPGNTENTYVIYAGKNIGRVVYIRNEGTDENVDTGLTAFNGVSTNATYKARSEFEWDEANGCLYQMEGDVKYVLVMKQMTASYNSGAETGTEWRMVGVPVAQATPEQGNYPVVLVNHVHNLSKTFEKEGNTYYRACGCGYHATVDAGIVLGESLGVNFDVKLEEGETVTATVAGNAAPIVLTENGAKYSAFVQLSAAQMTDAVKICVGDDALDVSFTVRAFANAVLADESYNQYAKDLMNHMLVYGSAAQNYFDHNTGDLAGEGVDVTVTMPEKTVGVAVQSDLEGVEFYGASVVHEGRTAVRFYFTADSVDGLTFTVDGNVYEPAQKDGMYYIEVAGINPQNLDQDMTALVTNGQQNLAVQYSPLTYITRTYHRADAPAVLKELVKAMYGYHKATKTYIANMYLGNDFALKSQTKTSLYDGVDQYASTYVAAGEGEVQAYAIVISADANVELKVSAGEWSASNTAENPGGTKTVVKHFRDMKNAGNNVLAMINGGFFDLNTGKTMKPFGMQIVDGVVKQAPAAGNYSDNWFGMTKDGKYVISDAAGYQSTYINNVQQGVGGGKLLVIDGQVQDLTSGRDYRTAVGVNAKGDLVLVAVENATYNDICQIFVDLNMDIVTVLNLDGGGSTAMYVPGAFYPKALILGEDGLLPREVADAVGVVVKP